MSRIPSIMAALAMTIGSSALGVAPAQALMLPQFSDDIAAAPAIEQVRHRRHDRFFFDDDFGRHHRRHRYRRHTRPHFEFWFGTPGFSFGTYDWRVACSHKYRSFNWRTGLYRGYDGRYHRCRLP
jgi:hypothetical protein